MKHIILKLTVLFVTMSVLTASRENANTCKGSQPLNKEHPCLHTCNGYAINITCRQSPVLHEKNHDATAEAMADNEISLSPISRFILLQ